MTFWETIVANRVYRYSVNHFWANAYYSHFTVLWLCRYQKKHSPTHTYRGHQSSLICFLHLLWSMASSLFNSCAWQSFSVVSQVFFCLRLGLAPSTSYFIHFFTQLLSSFCSTCPYHRNLFCCSTEIMWLVKYWHGYLFGARCRFICGPADTTATHNLLLQ